VTQEVPPPVTDRRAPERRSGPHLGRPSRQAEFDPRTALAAGVAFCGGLVVVFIFFWALGAVDVGQALATTSVVVLLALVWLGFYLYRSRQEETHEIRRERERRGF
jgi:VIT1/CCC1 family predicted Fe2+/Mn2+ transporter